MSDATSPTSTDYRFTPAPFTRVTIDDRFWSPRIETNRRVTIPYDFTKSEETGRVDNFLKAAGAMAGEHQGLFFNDSDLFKIIEGAAYSLQQHPDPALDAYLDDLIAKIGAAQEPDGYLYTPRTIAERNGTSDQLADDREGKSRWSNLRINHELYNVGHLYEAAVAHFQATGKRTLLDIALQSADLVDRTFGPDKIRDVPGHQEIEIGLVKLYHVTGQERYLRLAKFFLDERGHANGRALYTSFGHAGYMQDHAPVVEQDEAVGHAVRAVYMYCAMADVASLTGDSAYVAAMDRIWENVVDKKLYLTGGIGALHRGEAFGANYELPNDTAYTETCAAIGNVFWNQRMFQLHGHAKYVDVLERSLYNGFLPGISFGGDRFFYTNPLSFDGEFRFNRDDSLSRMPWFTCSCCPTNVVRVFPSLSGYIYATTDSELYVNLYVAGRGQMDVAGSPVTIRQQTDYPWDGRIRLTVEPETPAAWTLKLRIPGWAQGEPVPSDLYHYLDATAQPATVRVNGEPVAVALADVAAAKGYLAIHRTWQAGDTVELELPMPVRRVLCHPAVEANAGKVALERGPLVYCLEQADNHAPVLDQALPDDAALQVEDASDLLGGVKVIRAPGLGLTAVPYYAWAHRGAGQMTVWLDRPEG